MKVHRSALLGALALLHAGALAGPRLTIELRPQVQSTGPSVLLGDVAAIRTSELPLIRTLVRLPLGAAPGAGQSATLERDALADWIARRAGLQPGDVEWRGAAATRVSSAAQFLGGEAVATAAEGHLRDWLRRLGWSAEVQLRRAPPDLHLPTGALRLQPRALGAAPPRRRMLVWVDVWVAQRFVRTVPVGFALSLPVEPPLAGVPSQRTAALPVLSAAFESPAGAPGPGDALPRRADAAASPLVTRGQWAMLQSAVGIVRTEARVQVLQDGVRGDKVRVRHAASSAPMLARVTGPGRLEVAP